MVARRRRSPRPGLTSSTPRAPAMPSAARSRPISPAAWTRSWPPAPASRPAHWRPRFPAPTPESPTATLLIACLLTPEPQASATLLTCVDYGGRGGIRTLEAVLPPTRFPVARTRPGYATLPWRRGWDSNPRRLITSPLFESGTFNHSDTSPIL